MCRVMCQKKKPHKQNKNEDKKTQPREEKNTKNKI